MKATEKQMDIYNQHKAIDDNLDNWSFSPDGVTVFYLAQDGIIKIEPKKVKNKYSFYN